ncbi:hypothetical protein [Staphylococcus aureus]|uniref:hypothetical protein n=1 Tax=Staphylococcus aureus TaxID=1280 RepID=UPI00085C4F67|nr:hypothetical protein [Staphylococcus aureus]SCS29353.1 Uncharacterised protein [Staphylococcus aureus]
MNRNLLTILLLIGYTYLIFNFLTTEYSLAPRIFYTLNFISLSLILLAKAKSKKLNKHTHFLDEVQLVLEKRYSTIMYILNIALVVSFISFLTGFIYLREEYPQFILYSSVLLVMSFYYIKLFYEDKNNIIYMNRKIVDFNNSEVECQLQLDDGEKKVLLKQLDNFYKSTIILMFITEITLMFYSIISSNYQTVSMVLIAIVIFISSSLLITTNVYTNRN